MLDDQEPVALPPPIMSTGPVPYSHPNLRERPKEFERLTRGLLGVDTNLKNLTLYGLNGQKQYGIDVSGVRQDDGGLDVLSAKCVESVNPTDLTTWSDDFLKHRVKKWPKAKRFILAVAAENAIDVKVVDQIAAEAARFAQCDMEYELWGPETLTDRLLAAGPAVSRRFLGQDWTRKLFDTEPDTATSTSLLQQMGRLQGLMSDHVAARLTRGADLLRAGDLDAVQRLLDDVRLPATWDNLQDRVQAQAWRLTSSLALELGDVAGARSSAEAAVKLDPTQRRALAVLVHRDEGPDRALEVLGAPLSRSDRQLQAGLLLDKGDLEAARARVTALLAEDPADPESLRLSAMQLLLENRVGEGLATAQKAQALAPHHLMLNRALGVTYYATALAPPVPAQLKTTPTPTDFELVKADDRSQANLRAALAIFEALAGRAQAQPLDREWRLACLGNLIAEQAAASLACRDLLSRTPASTTAVAWGVMRALDFDRPAARAAFAALYEAGQADPYQVRTYALLISDIDGIAAAGEALRANLAAQTGEAKDAAESWLQNMSETDTVGGDDDTVYGALVAATERGDWTRLEPYLEAELGGQSPTWAGLALADEVAKKGRWRSLVPYVDSLARFETRAPVMIGIYALHHAATPEAALAYIAAHRGVFPASTMPVELRRIEMMANERAGKVRTALRLAEKLVADTNTLVDRMHLADIHLQAAHVQAALPTIREALGANFLTAERALRYSTAVTRQDRALAKALWRKAIAMGVPDHLVIFALSQGYKLDLNDEAETLMPRLHERALAGAKDVWIVDLDEVVQQVVAQRDRSENLTELVAAGAMPIHLVAGPLNLNLAALYWFAPRAKERGALPPLFLRHGARPVDHTLPTPWTRWRVHLDLTGLLIADQLGLWEHFDALEAPVVISSALPEVMQHLEHDATHHQASQVRIAKAIISARNTNRLTLQDAPAPAAQTVQHERTSARGDEPGPTVKSVVRSISATVTAGADGDLAAPPKAGERLFFPDNTLETVAIAGLLDEVLKRFRCEIPGEVFEEVVDLVQRAESQETLADWVGELKQKVATRVEDERFVYAQRRRLPEPEAESETDEADEDEATPRQPKPIEQCLMDLLAAPGGPTSVLWVDDRNVTGYPTAENKLIVGVVEVLDALLADDRLTPDTHQEKLRQLRAAGGVFVPIRKTEVLAALDRAPITDGAVVETPDLVVLRRNLAAAMRLDGKLKLGPTDIPNLDGRPDELPFMLAARRIVHECLIEMWGDLAVDEDTLRARSEWMWAALRQEQPLRVLPGGDDSGSLLASLNIAALLAGANHVAAGKLKATLPRRRAFVRWLNEVALEPRAGAGSAAFLDLVAKHLMTLADGVTPEELADETDGDVARANELLGVNRRRLFELLPPELQERLVVEPAFIAGTGLGTVAVLTVNNVTFKADPYWAAFVRALRSGAARVRAQDGRTLSMTAQHGVMIFSGPLNVRLREPWFEVLKAKAKDRPAATKTFLATLDLAPADTAAAQATIAAAKTESDLAEALRAAQVCSVNHYYANLSNTLRDGHQANQSHFMPPQAARLAHHLRLTTGKGSVASRAARAWPALSRKIGLGPTLRRLGGLPVPLAHAMAVDLKLKRAGLDALGDAHSPVAQLHLAAASAAMGDTQKAEDETRAVLQGLPKGGQLLATLLTWSHLAFATDESWRTMPTGDQLALVWSHAHRICTVLLEQGDQADYAIKFFTDARPVLDFGTNLWRNPEIEADCASPNAMYASGVAYHGLAYVFGDADVFTAAPGLAGDLRTFPFPAEGQPGELQPGLVTRDLSAPNVLGSFLNRAPVGLLPDGPDPVEKRASYIEAAMAQLEAEPTSVQHWAAVMGMGLPALPDAYRTRLDAVFDQVGLETIASPEYPSSGPALAIDVRRRLGTPESAGLVDRKIHDLATRNANLHRGPIEPDAQSPGMVALLATMEAAARAATGPDLSRALNRLSDLTLVIASGWPAAAASLRQIFDIYAREMSPRSGAPLWRAFVALRAWP